MNASTMKKTNFTACKFNVTLHNAAISRRFENVCFSTTRWCHVEVIAEAVTPAVYFYVQSAPWPTAFVAATTEIQLHKDVPFLGNNLIFLCGSVTNASWTGISSLRNWANHDRYRLRPSTPAQLCWSFSRLQPLQNSNLIKFAIIRPSTLNHDKNLWNCRGEPNETTCLTVFFSVSQRLSFNLYEIVWCLRQ